MEKRPAHLYLRVSTGTQDVENQLQSVNAYLLTAGLTQVSRCDDTESTKTHWTKRGIKTLIEAAAPGEHIVCAEVSRAARSVLEVLEIAKACAERGVSLHFAKSSLVLDASMQSRIIVTVLALCAEIDREFIRARTKEALQKRRADGITLGRPIGAKGTLKLATKGEKIKELQAAKIGIAGIARVLECSPSTLRRYLSRATA